jgi:Fuc2NAc and GlcNAc transferase
VIGALLVTLLASTLFCGIYLRLARRWRLLATPNARSSHRMPTPHGGGAPLLLAFALGLLAAALWHAPWATSYLVLAAVAMLLMLLGIADDLRALPVSLRFAAYGACCLAALLLLLPLPVSGSPWWDALLLSLATLAMLWLVNLYNFMDGIDGIAAIQCLLACCSAALLSWSRGGHEYALFCLLLAAGQLGFLVWNWPPARLFMGDAGSIPTGFLLAGLAVVGAVEGHLGVACWLILLAVFITDATWTLLWRVASGQAFMQAHRLHAYQRLSVHWNSHQRVDLLFTGVFCGWLLPLAWLCEIYPKYAFLLVILAYIPLLAAMAKTRPIA